MFRILLKMSIGIGRILVPRSGSVEFFRPFFILRKGAGEKKKLNMIDLKIHKLQYFLKLRKPSELAFILNTSDELILSFIKTPIYNEFFIPKKNGGKRKIQTPSHDLMIIQKKLSNYLQDIYSRMQPSMVHGYVKSNFIGNPNKSIITHAKAHVGKKFVLNLDVNDFFGSITTKHIFKLFRSSPFHFPEQLAVATTLLCTYHGKLPQGAPTSPVLSNLVFRKLDENIFNFCHAFNITYTRYADDLTFSTNEPAFKNTATTTFKNQIEKYLSIENFKLNEEKICLRTDKQKQKVTGLKVNKKLNVERNYKKRVRAMLHDYKVNGLEKAAEKYFKKWRPNEKVDTVKFLGILKGKISFIESVQNSNNSDKK